MTRKRLRVALAVALVLGVAAVTSFAVVGAATAHDSDCHAQQTCPSDDHSYVWSDGTTQWDCAIAGGPSYGEQVTTIVYDGVRYSCANVSSEPPAPEPVPERSPPEDSDEYAAEPPPPPPPPPPAAPKPTKKKTTESDAPTAEEETETGAGPISPPVAPTPFGPQVPSRSPVLPSGRYVFPVDGPSSYGDTFGAPRETTGWHHGVDIFAPLGTPVVAVADGTLLRVGWNAVGGNRLWLRDRWGNYFYYAHLSGFAPGAISGASVLRGEVIGYVGNTGDAQGTPYHLHFEIHPASLLGLGYDGVVNPSPYLAQWQRASESIRTGRIAAGVAPTPGAILLTAADISTASGLERKALMRRASSPILVLPEGTLLPPLPPGVAREVPPGGGRVAGILDRAASSFAVVPGATVWDTLAQCESGGDWHANTGLFDGGLQFHPNTWTRYGGTAFAPYAYLATREQQITIARRTLAAEGWDAWPACSLKLGLR